MPQPSRAAQFEQGVSLDRIGARTLRAADRAWAEDPEARSQLQDHNIEFYFEFYLCILQARIFPTCRDTNKVPSYYLLLDSISGREVPCEQSSMIC